MRILFIAISFLAIATINAQTKPAIKPTGTAPIVSATIGKLTEGTYKVAVLKKIIDSVLVLKDAKGVKYTIDRFSFLYKRKTKFEDEQTGKKGTGWEYLEKILKNGTQLDELWKSTIKKDLQAGEQLIFASIMADTKKGYKIPVKTIILTAE